MTAKNLVQPSSVVLVSGGARGITAQCVVRLAERARCKFIFLGRSSAADPVPDWARDCPGEAELKQRILSDLKARGEKPSLQKLQSK